MKKGEEFRPEPEEHSPSGVGESAHGVADQRDKNRDRQYREECGDHPLKEGHCTARRSPAPKILSCRTFDIGEKIGKREARRAGNSAGAPPSRFASAVTEWVLSHRQCAGRVCGTRNARRSPA